MIATGTKIGGYVVIRSLGSGGTSTVYAVRHAVLGTMHALKVVHEPHLVQRLRTEGELQSRIASRHVLPVQAMIEAAGQPALLMPLVRGCSLKELLEVRRLTRDEAHALFMGIVDGVVAAHEFRVVHRDLKPSNVLLDIVNDEVMPRIADFGVARTEHSTATEAGEFLGTRTYAAPEQLRDASSVDSRADLYSLGVVFYEMLTGRRPNPLTSRPTGLPAFADIVARLMEVDPAHRFDSAAALRNQLGEAPSRVLEASGPLGQWVQQRFALVNDATETTPVDAPQPLPLERDAFVGRTGALQQLALTTAQATLTTITGLGGIGKTRLLTHFLSQSANPDARGAYWCDLAEARDEESSVLALVAEGLGLAPGRLDVARIGFTLRKRAPCVVALDNAERATGTLRRVLPRWMAHAPLASFIVTSRIPLEIPGEKMLSLEPLDFGPGRALFLDRARAADPTFDPTTTPEALDDLVAALDGIPLAIELAARRVRLLDVPDILARLVDRFELLRAVPGRHLRHATLQATLDDSWELLGSDERRGLAQLSVFEGVFPVSLAEAVLDVSSWPLDVLDRLLAASLVQAAGPGYLRLLDTVRTYAARALEDFGERFTTQVRHGRALARLSEQHVPTAEQFRSQRKGPLAPVGRDLVVACERAIERNDVEIAVSTLRGALTALEQRGGIATLLPVAERTLPVARHSTVWLAATWDVYANGLRYVGRLIEAEDAYSSAIAQWRRLGDELGEAAALVRQGGLFMDLGRHDESTRALSAARHMALRHGSLRLVTVADSILGILAHLAGRTQEAQSRYEATLETSRARGYTFEEGKASNYLGALCTARGEFTAARRHLLRAQACFTLLDAPQELPSVYIHLANLSILEGRLADAERHLVQALNQTQEQGFPRDHAIALGNLGVVLEEKGEYARAIQVFEEARAMNLRVGNPRVAAIAQLNLGRLRAAHEDLEASLPVAHDALDQLARLGDRTTEIEGRVELVGVLLRFGRLHQADEELRRAWELLEQSDNAVFRQLASARQGDLAAHRGARAEALRHWKTANEGLEALGADGERAKVLAQRSILEACWDIESATSSLAAAEALAAGLRAPPGGSLDRAIRSAHRAIQKVG